LSTKANATFKTQSWDEAPYREIEGEPKMTRVTTTKTFEGDIEGEGSVEYLMMYRADGTASFVGLEVVVGRIGDRSGSFVLQHLGDYEGGKAKASWRVVPGSATGELAGLKGVGGFASPHAESYPMTLEYDFE
jgi:hypothetical protein